MISTNAPARSFETFAALRAELLAVIGSATDQLWLQTDFVSDGDIVSALFLAQYRDVDVKVVLGRERASHFRSRLHFFKNNDIPVFLRPPEFAPRVPTALLSDRRVYFVDADLDGRTRRRSFRLTIADGAQAEQFVASFRNAVFEGRPAVPGPRPEVGRGRQRGRIYAPPAQQAGKVAGVYRYSVQRQSGAPPGMPRRLPQATLRQQRSQAAGRSQEQGGRGPGGR